MNTLQIFFSEFWPFFVGTVLILPLLQWGRHVSLDGNAAVFVGPNSFRELAGFSKDEQRRLLHQADGAAFPRWRFFFPVLIHATIFSGSIAMGRTLPKITPLPDSFWVSVGFMTLFIVLGFWFAGRWEAHRVRPFLRTLIERSHHAA